MKTTVAIVCLMAVATAVHGMDQEVIVQKYLDYLMPDVRPCAEQFHVSEDVTTNIHKANSVDMNTLGCMKACVMKRMQILTGNNEFHIEPVMKMIETIHSDSEDDRKLVTAIANECISNVQGETDECQIGNKYTDCYVDKLFNS